MTNTYFTSERTVVKNRAQGYEPAAGGFQHAHYLNMDWPFAAGSIESTTLDLAKWDAALYGDKILPQPSLKQMWTPTVLPSGKTQQYGFGWQTDKVNGIDLVQHGGGIHGFITFIRRAPSKGLTVIVLTNSGSGPADKLAAEVMAMADPSLKPVPAKAIADNDGTATQHARDVLQSILDGKLDRTKLTAEFNKALTSDMEQNVGSQLASLGPINGFELTSNSVAAGMTVRIYQVTLGSTLVKMTMAVNAQGQIAGLSFKPQS